MRICLHTCFHGSTETFHAFGGSRSRDSSFSVFSCPGPRSGVNSATRSPPQRLQSLTLRGSRARPTENRRRPGTRPPRLLPSPRPSLCARGAPPFRRRCQDDGASLAAQPTPGPACSAQSRCFRGPRPVPGPARHDSAPPRPSPPAGKNSRAAMTSRGPGRASRTREMEEKEQLRRQIRLLQGGSGRARVGPGSRVRLFTLTSRRAPIRLPEGGRSPPAVSTARWGRVGRG